MVFLCVYCWSGTSYVDQAVLESMSAGITSVPTYSTQIYPFPVTSGILSFKLLPIFSLPWLYLFSKGTDCSTHQLHCLAEFEHSRNAQGLNSSKAFAFLYWLKYMLSQHIYQRLSIMLNMGRYTHMQRIALESHEITKPLLPQSLDK